MDEMLKLLLEVQKIKDTVNNIDDRLKKIEMAHSRNISTPGSINESSKVHENQYVKNLVVQRPQDIETELQDTWNRIIEVVKKELTEVCFNTWIKTIKLKAINNKTVYLSVPSYFNKGILEQRYNVLIKKATLEY